MLACHRGSRGSLGTHKRAATQQVEYPTRPHTIASREPATSTDRKLPTMAHNFCKVESDIDRLLEDDGDFGVAVHQGDDGCECGTKADRAAMPGR